MMLQTKSYMYTCVHVSGNMLKFIRQKRGAECEHSEEFGEVDKRHKLTLSTWSDNVNLNASPDVECDNEVLLGLYPHPHDGVSHCLCGNPFPCAREVLLCLLHKVRTWWGDPANRLPKGSFVVPM